MSDDSGDDGVSLGNLAAIDDEFRLIAESIPHILWMSSPDGSAAFLNGEGWNYSGVGAAGEHASNWIEIIHPDDLDRVLSAWTEANRTHSRYSIECRIQRFDHEYRWHAFRARALCDPEGNVLRWIGTMTDIEDTKRLEAELRFQAELLGAVGHAIVAVDTDRRIIYWNTAAEEMYGWSAVEAVGRTSVEVLPRVESPDVEREVADAMRRGETWSGDYEIERRDGTRLAVLVTNRPMFGPDGRVVAVIGSSIDVTQRKAGEDAAQQLSAIVEGSGDAIFGVTDDGMVTSWNGAAERMFGYRAQDIVGRPVAVLAPPALLGEQIAVRQSLRHPGAHRRLETTRMHRDGTAVEVLLTASTTTDAHGRVSGLSVIAQDISQRLAAQRALELSRRRLADAQRTARIGSFEFDQVRNELVWSEEYYRVLGVDPGTSPSPALFLSFVFPEDREAVHAAWLDALIRARSFDIEFRVRRPVGDERWAHARGVPELDEDGHVVRLCGSLMDITDRVCADQVRRAAETRFEIGFEQSAIGAVISDMAGVPTRVNGAACAILGRPASMLVGRRWTEYSHPDDVPLGVAATAWFDDGHDTYADERRYVRPDGTVVWTSTNLTVVRDEHGTHQYISMQLQDITARKKLENELAHEAMHDSLTGLPNRALLIDRLVHGLAMSRRRGTPLGVMFVDIDQFKLINDTWGHGAGDDLLKHVAGQIELVVRPGDTVARLGGDEFVIVCDDVTVHEIEQIAGRLLAALAHPWQLGDEKVHITASVGIALADEASTPERLLRHSDAAMYRAKERGKGRVELFDDTLRSVSEQRWATASALHRALEHGEFEVHYQPVVDLLTGTMVSVEALLRWNHPGRGIVSPAEFIPLAEETGLVVPLGAWVLERACRDLVGWQQLDGAAAGMSVAVNLSVRQVLAPDIATLIEGVLRRTGLDAGRLCLELTESVFMGDVDYFARTLLSLKALGVSLSIDDFGMGYSSLGYLKRFPVDGVKVDRSFVDGLGVDPHDTALVAAIVAMAFALDLEVTAEGVETDRQLQGLRALNVTRAQGFLLATPMPADAIARLILEDHRWPAVTVAATGGRQL